MIPCRLLLCLFIYRVILRLCIQMRKRILTTLNNQIVQRNILALCQLLKLLRQRERHPKGFVDIFFFFYFEQAYHPFLLHVFILI